MSDNPKRDKHFTKKGEFFAIERILGIRFEAKIQAKNQTDFIN
jgi:hypothetical protein